MTPDAGAESSAGPSAPSGLVLASTSSYRKALLERLGLPFVAVAPGLDEAAVPTAGRTPRELAEYLAREKAALVAASRPGATVIGCDQLVSLGGRVFGKPGTAARAAEQLVAMAGRTHELITAMVVIGGGRELRHTDVTRLRMRSLSRDEIGRYVERDRPLDCAGSYKLEERGIALFERIETADHTAITGLPLIALTTILRELGYPVP